MIKNTITKKRQEGFTIIEVLIVLAIAGLIILIVFLAVPALQRNSRNTQRKNDVSALGGALAEYVTNNGGQLPLNDAAFAANVETNAKTSFFDATIPTAIVYTRNPNAIAPGGPAAGVNDVVQVHTNSKCISAAASTATGATARSVIALYRVEIGGTGGSQPQCQEL